MTKLNDKEVKALQSKDKAYYIHDDRGLYIHVKPSGVKSWQYRYKIGNKTRQLGLGLYPEVSLASARREHDELRQKVKAGIDPAAKVITDEEEIAKFNYKNVALRWFAARESHLNKKYASKMLRTLESDVFPVFGERDIRTITKREALDFLTTVANSGRLEVLKKLKQRLAAIHSFASLDSPDVPDLRRAFDGLLKTRKTKPMPALTDIESLRQILCDVAAATAQPVTRLAIYLTALTAMRNSEIRYAEWADFKLNAPDGPVWVVPAEKMKMKREHIVYLSPQAVAVLETVKQISGNQRYVFPSVSQVNRPICENSMGYLLIRLGYKNRHCVHGFRAAFSSIMNDVHPDWSAAIDKMLAHEKKDAIERAYNRASYIKQSRQISDEWGALLMDGVPHPSQLLNGPRH